MKRNIAFSVIGLIVGLWFGFMAANASFRRDASALGLVGSAALMSTFASMFWYNALVTPLAFTFCAYALLWRNHLEGEGTP